MHAAGPSMHTSQWVPCRLYSQPDALEWQHSAQNQPACQLLTVYAASLSEQLAGGPRQEADMYAFAKTWGSAPLDCSAHCQSASCFLDGKRNVLQ